MELTFFNPRGPAYFALLTSKESFPTLPTMVQGALNATNICFEAVGEVELLSTVAARAQHLMDAGKMPDFAKLAELSCQLLDLFQHMPMCLESLFNALVVAPLGQQSST